LSTGGLVFLKRQGYLFHGFLEDIIMTRFMIDHEVRSAFSTGERANSAKDRGIMRLRYEIVIIEFAECAPRFLVSIEIVNTGNLANRPRKGDDAERTLLANGLLASIQTS
jgi:hypothetical protein